MRHSILTIVIVAISILNANATNKIETPNSVEAIEITRDAIAQVFEWEVETTKSTYSGTALSLKEAQNMMALSSSGEVVRSKEIKSYLVLKSELNSNTKRNYFWEVETKTGKAKGYASNKAYADKMIELVASGDAIVSKIIINQPQQ
ncbi:hypothetical protein GSB9_01909 [Flavobacteriaceae bacterium GSB9]|nr:hypothetical protein GSB9_01909 [Flavobacteriaceae bacterium GSB9]